MSHEDLQARLAAAEARRAELAERRDKVDAERALKERVAAAEREATELEALEQLEQEHGELGHKLLRVDTPEGMIVLKKAAFVVVKRYMDKGKATTEAYDKLVRPSVVYPDRAEFQRLVEEYPATLNLCADAVCWLAGWGRKEGEVAGK